MATGSCQGIMKSIATTEILPWLQHAAVVIGGKNGAGALHTRIRPVSVRRMGGRLRAHSLLQLCGGALRKLVGSLMAIWLGWILSAREV